MGHDEMAPQHGAAESDTAGTSVSHVSFEHLRDALGTGTARPRLSWLVATPTQNWRQTGYEVEAYGGLRERTRQIESEESVLVSWPFAPLRSRERLMIRVRVWGPDKQPSAWSGPAGHCPDTMTTIGQVCNRLHGISIPLLRRAGRRFELLSPVNISTSPAGRFIPDFGQNLVGRLRISVQGPAGQVITLRHAEVLQNGELCTRPLRTAQATDTYILRGAGVETWEPHFTIHGFRYAEVDGWPVPLQPDDIHAMICHYSGI